MTAGRGWIALALVVFATWKPWRVLAGAYLFGGVTLAQFQAQALGVDVPSQLLAMLPYVATIVVLAHRFRATPPRSASMRPRRSASRSIRTPDGPASCRASWSASPNGIRGQRAVDSPMRGSIAIHVRSR